MIPSADLSRRQDAVQLRPTGGEAQCAQAREHRKMVRIDARRAERLACEPPDRDVGEHPDRDRADDAAWADAVSEGWRS